MSDASDVDADAPRIAYSIGPHTPECPECPEDGSYDVSWEGRSFTFDAIVPATWDRRGRYHPPADPNMVTRTLRCSNGHEWRVTRRVDRNYEAKIDRRVRAGLIENREDY